MQSKRSSLDPDIFQTEMGILCDYFNHTLTTEVSKLYWDYLKKYKDETFKGILKELIESWKPGYNQPFPLLADFKLCVAKLSGKAILTAREVAREKEHDEVRNFSHDQEGLDFQYAVWSSFGKELSEDADQAEKEE